MNLALPLLALMLAADAPQPSPSPASALYFEQLSPAAAAEDTPATVRAAISRALGVALLPGASRTTREPYNNRETICKEVPVQYLVVVRGTELTVISGPHGGKITLDLSIWTWNCSQHREGPSATVRPNSYFDRGDAPGIRSAFAAIVSSALDRFRASVAAPPDYP